MNDTLASKSHCTAQVPRYLEYLCVNNFLGNPAHAQALKTALELSVVDRLSKSDNCSVRHLGEGLGCDNAGLQFLLELLESNQVVQEHRGEFSLTPQFRTAMKYRDLIEAKLDFSQYVAPDLIDRFTSLIVNPHQFMRRSRVFDLFDYSRCFESTSENYDHTNAWMRFTTALTKYESRACMEYRDFGNDREVLDVGGNSGEFVLQLCKFHPKLRATVFDLPVVCDIARQHLALYPEADRIRLVRGNAVTGPLPGGVDLVAFKSFLHDWPEEQVATLLGKAQQSLVPGGTLLIFERSPIRVTNSPPDWSLLPMLLLFRSFRGPEFYEQQLEAIGLCNIETRQIDLDVPFLLITAQKH